MELRCIILMCVLYIDVKIHGDICFICVDIKLDIWPFHTAVSSVGWKEDKTYNDDIYLNKVAINPYRRVY